MKAEASETEVSGQTEEDDADETKAEERPSARRSQESCRKLRGVNVILSSPFFVTVVVSLDIAVLSSFSPLAMLGHPLCMLLVC